MTSGGTGGTVTPAVTYPVPATVTPDPSIHDTPSYLQGTGPTGTQTSAWRNQFIDLILQQVIMAIQGFFTIGKSAFDQVASIFEKIPFIGPIVHAITGIVDGGLNDISLFFGDLLGIFGGPTGLGTGNVNLAPFANIPIFGPFLDVVFDFVEPIFGGVLGGGSPLDIFFNIFNDVLGLFGNPSGMGTGDPIIGAVENIPILGPFLGMFVQFFEDITGGIFGGGASSSGPLGGFFGIFNDLFGLLGNPTGLGTGSPSILNDIPILGPLINTLIGGLGGSGNTSGGLFGLGNILGDFFGILGSPTGMGTGSPTPSNNIPLLGPLISTFNTAFGSIGTELSTLEASLTSFVGGLTSVPAGIASGVATFASDFIAGLAGILGGTVGHSAGAAAAANTAALGTAAWQGASGSVAHAPVSNNDVQAAVADAAAAAQAALRTASSVQAQLAALTAQNDANNGAGGTFTRITPPSGTGPLPAIDFPLIRPPGDLGAVGGSITTSAFTDYPAVRNYCSTLGHNYTTDDQSIIITLGPGGQVPAVHSYAMTHCNAAMTEGVAVQINVEGVAVGKFTYATDTAFVFTPFAGGTHSATMFAGSKIQLHNVGSVWTVLIEDNPVLSVTDSSVTFDAAHRTPGIGTEINPQLTDYGIWPAGPYLSFAIADISLGDFVQPTFAGSGAVICRTSSVSVAQVLGGPNVQNGLFDTVIQKTADYTVDLTHTKITPANADWYIVSIGYLSDSPLYPVLMKNGSAYQNGSAIAPGTKTGGGGQSTFIIYLTTGDNVEAGYTGTGTPGSFIGDGTGENNYMSIARIPRPIAA